MLCKQIQFECVAFILVCSLMLLFRTDQNLVAAWWFLSRVYWAMGRLCAYLIKVKFGSGGYGLWCLPQALLDCSTFISTQAIWVAFALFPGHSHCPGFDCLHDQKLEVGTAWNKAGVALYWHGKHMKNSPLIRIDGDAVQLQRTEYGRGTIRRPSWTWIFIYIS